MKITLFSAVISIAFQETKASARVFFIFPFIIDFKKFEYILSKNGLNLKHNHVSAPIFVYGILFKRKKADFETDENSTILGLFPVLTLGSLRILRTKWQNIGLSSELLYRLKSKAKKNVFGTHEDAIN